MRSKKTISVIPAFLFSRKRASVRYFFDLLSIYTEENLSIERLWCFHDREGAFKSIRTLYRYHRALFLQIDKILKCLVSEIIGLSSSYEPPEISPADGVAHRKLEILFQALDTLVELLHKKNGIDFILDEEKYSFLHCFLFQRANIILLDTS